MRHSFLETYHGKYKLCGPAFFTKGSFFVSRGHLTLNQDVLQKPLQEFLVKRALFSMLCNKFLRVKKKIFSAVIVRIKIKL